MDIQRRRLLWLAACAAGLPIAGIAKAQAYPAKPVRVIVPFAAGGPTDVFARLIALSLSRALGQQFYVENQPGPAATLEATFWPR
jgi:tripartite-type tricarboxylate transporter receptor subunit TctC